MPLRPNPKLTPEQFQKLAVTAVEMFITEWKKAAVESEDKEAFPPELDEGEWWSQLNTWFAFLGEEK